MATVRLLILEVALVGCWPGDSTRPNFSCTPSSGKKREVEEEGLRAPCCSSGSGGRNDDLAPPLSLGLLYVFPVILITSSCLTAAMVNEETCVH